MSNALYPVTIKGLTWTVLKRPQWETLVQASPANVETRIAQSQNPIWHWQFIYDYLYGDWPSPANTKPFTPYTDFQYFAGFFMGRQGMFDSFLFDDVSDDSVGPAITTNGLNTSPAGSGTANTGGFTFAGVQYLPAQLQLFHDTVADIWYSPIQRNFGGQFLEDITDLKPAGGADHSALAVYANGVLRAYTTDYTLIGPGVAVNGAAWAGLVIRWTAMPTGPITAQFGYYFRTRFEMDDQDYEQFMRFLYTIGGSGGKNGRGTVQLMSARTAQ